LFVLQVFNAFFLFSSFTILKNFNIFSSSFSEVYYKAGISPEQFQQQLEYQLRKTTLGVSVGLVKGKELEVASYFNPYLHFVPSLLNGTEKESNRYKICETKPPSIEKVSNSYPCFFKHDFTKVLICEMLLKALSCN
jgi:hypothetical protein